MKIYRIGMYENPTTESLMAMKSIAFAHFSALGTWSEGEVCGVCGLHTYDIVAPLLVRWERSSSAAGDFSWDGLFGYMFIVRERVVEFFRARQMECEFLTVEYVPPERRAGAACVAYPYAGPTLFWGNCETYLELDMPASDVAVTKSCAACGGVDYTFRSRGIVIPRENFHGEKLFRIKTNGRSAATFATEEAHHLIRNAGLSNIAFSEAGEILDV